MGRVIAIVGAESTGKTTLAEALRNALRDQGHSVGGVAEYLREFCDVHGRTPRVDEQQQIADEQSRRVEAAAATHDIVIADSSALVTAVYSEYYFGDTSLHAAAEAWHSQRCALTLLSALDLPWESDRFIRDEPSQEPVDTLVRASLQRAGVAFAVVSGQGPLRLQSALSAVRHLLGTPTPEDEARANRAWHWVCERCGDTDCERHLLARERQQPD